MKWGRGGKERECKNVGVGSSGLKALKGTRILHSMQKIESKNKPELLGFIPVSIAVSIV